MNSCILMAEIIDDPQLRYTPDGLELTEMMVQFPGLRQEDPSGMLRVVSWGSIAKDVKENYHKGDRIILEGRLGMNTIQHREGFKEKKAELTVGRIYALGAVDTTLSAVEKATAVTPSRQVEKTVSSYESSPPPPLPTPSAKKPPANNIQEPEEDQTPPKPQTPKYQPTNYPQPEQEPDIDDIPF